MHFNIVQIMHFYIEFYYRYLIYSNMISQCRKFMHLPNMVLLERRNMQIDMNLIDSIYELYLL